MMQSLLVTTSQDPDPPMEDRARRVARRCGAPFRRRTGSVEELVRTEGVGLAYVVARARDELRRGDLRLFVHQGLLRQRLSTGDRHALLRAVSPGGETVEHIVDATAGLGVDALHLAGALEAEVEAIEASPPLHSLLEEGLARLARGPEPAAGAAARIRLRSGRAEAALADMEPASVDVVYLDPMFSSARRAAPGFDLLRAVALAEPASTVLIERALRVARRRVVLKTAPGAEPAGPWTGRAHGKALTYLVADRCRVVHPGA